MTSPPDVIRLERTIAAAPDRVWEVWTTAGGIEQWWSPDGFRTEVRAIELRPGGTLVHAMTAVAPEMVAFCERDGLPLTTEATKTFVEVDAPRRIAYTSTVDFVPGVEPYEHLTVVELESVDDGARTRVVEIIDPMHDADWTGRVVAGRENELTNLEALLTER